jgi:Xaa-Pro aminopeptidase
VTHQPSRADRLAERVAERELDALLVTELFNLRWLTGFTGTNGLALVGAGRDGSRRFATDFRYVEQAAEEVSAFERVRAPQELLEAVRDSLPDGVDRLGFDDAHLTVKQYNRLRALLPDGIELVAAGGLLEQERAIKEPAELDRIRAAAVLADEALGDLLEAGLAGRTERAIALALEDAMRRRGASAPSFPSIVAAGAHGALPHAQPRDVPVPKGALVVIDWGALLDGYCSDCTRTLATGELEGDARETYELVRRAQQAALEAVAPGPLGREIDAVARDIITEAGKGELFGHGLGHGVGLEVHEGPRLSRLGEDALVPGNVVTVEPGVYVPGRFGVRIEDLVVVTDEGHEVFSAFPKELTFVD